MGRAAEVEQRKLVLGRETGRKMKALQNRVLGPGTPLSSREPLKQYTGLSQDD